MIKEFMEASLLKLEAQYFRRRRKKHEKKWQIVKFRVNQSDRGRLEGGHRQSPSGEPEEVD